MFNQLVALLEEVSEVDTGTTTTFKAMTMIRDELEISITRMTLGNYSPRLAHELAETIATNIQLNLPNSLTDEQINQLVTPFVKAINNLVSAMLDKGFDYKGIGNIASQLSLSMSE